MKQKQNVNTSSNISHEGLHQSSDEFIRQLSNFLHQKLYATLVKRYSNLINQIKRQSK